MQNELIKPNDRNQKLIAKYNGQLLGMRDWKPPMPHVPTKFYVRHFSNPDHFQLMDFLCEMIFDGTCCLTKTGARFLREYYGFDRIAKMIWEEHPGNSELKSIENVIYILECKEFDAIDM